MLLSISSALLTCILFWLGRQTLGLIASGILVLIARADAGLRKGILRTLSFMLRLRLRLQNRLKFVLLTMASVAVLVRRLASFGCRVLTFVRRVPVIMVRTLIR